MTNEWADCNLNENVNNQIGQLNQTLWQNVSASLKSINNTSLRQGFLKLEKVFTGLQKNSSQFVPKIFPINKKKGSIETGSTQFSQLFRSLQNFSELFNKTIEPSRQEFEKGLGQQEAQQQMAKTQFNAELNKSITTEKNSMIAKNNMEARLNQTQFPFGKLPLNLDESVAAFPPALAIGFIMSSASLSNSIRLRKELHSLYKTKYPERTILNQKISLKAPLWMNPISCRVERLIKFIIFMIPLVVFIVSCILILYYVIFEKRIMSRLLFSMVRLMTLGFM